MRRLTKSQKLKAQLSLDLQNIFSLTPDRWGHFKFKSASQTIYRVKLQKTSFRFELKTSTGWRRVATFMYSQAKATDPQVKAFLIGCTQA